MNVDLMQVDHGDEHFEMTYVPHCFIDEYRVRGWRVVSQMSEIHHGDHVVLMRRDAS